MTVTYTGEVANARLGAFSRLLLYWRGSIYKLMYMEILIFCALYAAFSLLYRFALADDQKRLFERISLYCEAFTNLIPLSFVLGFYIAIVVTRWWNQFLCIPWPDRLMMYTTTMIEGFDERSRIIRRTLMRYATLSSLIVFQATSVSVKKRFPTMDHLLEAGVITPWEVKALDDVRTPHGKWWVPFVWSVNLVKEARKEGRISDDYLMKTLMEELMTLRGNLGMLLSYDWISVPLVYTQVTTLAVYTFFLGCLFGRQFLDPSQGYEGHNVDLYVPLFTILQFFFYMGWLKVAEQLINPFGEDDDDFDMNWILDRNLQVSLICSDDLHGCIPPLEKDIYFGEEAPECLPYTKSSVSSIREPFVGSTADLSVSNDGMKVVTTPMETIQEGVEGISSPYMLSRGGSVLNSPDLGRHRLHHNMVNGIRSPFDISRSTLDGLKTAGQPEGKSVVQTLNGSVLTKATSYLEGWLSNNTSRQDLQRQFSNVSGRHVLAPKPAEDSVSVVITMDGDDKAPLENPALARVRDEEETAPRGRSASFGHRRHDFKVSACPESMLNENSHVVVVHASPTTDSLNELAKSVSAPQTPDEPPKKERQLSTSSTESLPSYEPPYSNQSTVTSITPLLLSSHGDVV